jgi:PPOX class probable F420-dependent enzyme
MTVNRELSTHELELLGEARRAVLATTASDNRARLVPVTFAISITGQSKLPVLYSALDDKPKSVADSRDLARVRDIVARPRVTLLVDRWSEDWTQLAWLRLEGAASLVDADDTPEHDTAVNLLRAKYPQYARHRLEDAPVIKIEVDRVTGWRSDG